MLANGFAERRTGILRTCGRPPLHPIERGLVKTLTKGFSDQRPRGHVMSTDSGMDLDKELFPLVGRDALHEYS